MLDVAPPFPLLEENPSSGTVSIKSPHPGSALSNTSTRGPTVLIPANHAFLQMMYPPAYCSWLAFHHWRLPGKYLILPKQTFNFFLLKYIWHTLCYFQMYYIIIWHHTGILSSKCFYDKLCMFCANEIRLHTSSGCFFPNLIMCNSTEIFLINTCYLLLSKPK